MIVYVLETTMKPRLWDPYLFNDGCAKHTGRLKKNAGGVKCFCGLELDVTVLKLVSAVLYSPGDGGFTFTE